MPPSPLVTVDWLAEQLHQGRTDIRVVDCSWYMPQWKRDPRAEYSEAHIPGAVYYDMTECRDKSHAKNLPHMLPSGGQFADYVGKLGIKNSDHVVLYDDDNKFGMFSSPRVWWVFSVHGHSAVSILDGGMEQWKKQKQQLTSEVPDVTPVSYTSSVQPEVSVRSYQQVLDNLESRDFLLLDARPEGRFRGTAPEPIPNIKSGRIPHAVNLPWPSIMDSGTKQLKAPDQLKVTFAKAGLDLDKPTVLMCGTAVTACHLLFAIYVTTGKLLPLYDGAWIEWFLTAPDHLKVDLQKD